MRGEPKIFVCVRPCVRASVYKNTKFYRGAKALSPVGVSEVKERFGFRHDFLVTPDFHRFRGKGMIFRVPKKDPFLSTC